ncbi:OmpA/MotB family protein [Halochromatium salexigens]|uniref:Flagellar motor protein MotB n=1 Tax=Halochromatium salexigens TaxID=49447 RepID=A0AAJ0UE16_HALSE|nr:OmpA family protein [Halochromatium salexigens]MBK5929726.1 flagellar motor protein MotB [Halochromatium salexigens]
MVQRARVSMLETPRGGDQTESWLISYLDVLTLLITLFVLMVSMLGKAEYETQTQPGIPSAEIGPKASGIQPRHDGLQPRFEGLQMEGVSVDEGEQGITLRIDDNLLFKSGQAELTAGGGEVIESLVPMLESFEGQISVEGHTDNIPIATARFPSNWELSTARAIAVLRYLSAAGIPETRLRAIGYADTQPLESNETPEGRAANRRVELLLKQTL